MDSPNNTAEEGEDISFHSVKQKWARQEQLTKQTTPPRTTTLNPRPSLPPFVADPVSGPVPAALAPPAVALSLGKNPFEDDILADDPPTSSASLIASAFEARIAELARLGTSRPSSVSSLELQPGSRTPSTSRPSTPPQPTATAAVTPPSAAASDPSELPLSQRVSLLTQQFRTADAALAPSSAPRTTIKNSPQPTVPAPSKRSSLAAPSHPQQTFQPAAAETNPFDERDEETDNAVQDETAPQRPTPPVASNSASGTSPAKRTPPPPPPSRRPRVVQVESMANELMPPIPQRPVRSDVEKPALPTRPALPVRPVLAQGVKQNMEAAVMCPTQLSHSHGDEEGDVFNMLPPSLPPRPGQVIDDAGALPKLPPRRASSYISRAMSTAPDKPPALPSRPGATDSGARTSQQLKSGSFESFKTYDTDSTAEFLPKPDPRRFSSPAEKHATLAPAPVSTITNNLIFNRRPPTFPSGGRSEIQHKGPFKSLAISGSYIVTGMNQTRVWDSTTGDNIRTIYHAQGGGDVRVLSMAFAPTLHPDDDGRYLWTGLHDGQLWCIDIRTGEKITSVSNAHSHPVTHILRHAQVELWTLDDSGVLQCWSDRSPPGFDDAGALTLDGHARRVRVAQRQPYACVVGDRLWTADARAIEVFNVSADDPATTSLTLRPLSAGSDVGNITALCVTPDATRVYVAHDDGKVSMWDPIARVRIGVVSVSPYGIAAMAVVTGGEVWAGFNTGMVYVYDTKPEIWTVQKAWKAVQGPVQALVVDVTGLVREGVERVACVETGNVKVYNGLMTEDWIEDMMRKHESEYCTYRDVRMLVCSWNIDACKPDGLEPREDLRYLREWLGSMEDPDILAIGIQEIVDLESKRQNASMFGLRGDSDKHDAPVHGLCIFVPIAESFFSSKKKSMTEEEEMLTHRYRLWHDKFVHMIREMYGDMYTVIKTEHLVGLFSCILAKSSEADRITDRGGTVVKTGLKGLHGNKGGIAIRFIFDDSSICLVNCHLAAGQTHTQQRNQDADSILQQATLDRPKADYAGVFVNGGNGSMVLDHEVCVVSGDLNYRIDLPRDRVIRAVESSITDWPTQRAVLLEYDQLNRQMAKNKLFRLGAFTESPITFLPTYKYNPGTDHYDRSEKKRVPAWCDRILYRGEGVNCISYERFECRVSDHRPISAGFIVKVKTIDPRRKMDLKGKVEAGWADRLERMVRKAKIEYLAGFGYHREQAVQVLEQVGWVVGRAIGRLLG
ncbi:hypothetical protein BC937DRAFT_89508 [Endogone sp. FLAS-F59071]|nr:hypothetical protein BC937DRAFT_89508 [Endogone sp. FLAS-F59071]|eukprot:RUS17772.1 hypothetical protein BC937DRAFT_89508 [Endogone sp. FLAS-F59071]